MDSIHQPIKQPLPLPVPSSAIPPVADASPPDHAGASAASKARFWDCIAVKYAADPIADMAGYECTLQRVKDLLTADQDVLEIGCGTGTTALRLAPLTRRLLATDVSTGMIAIAREKLAAQPVPQLSFAVADADEPVAGPSEFDAVLAFNLLHLVPDLDHTLAQVLRHLRPGGLFISKTPCVGQMNPLVPHVALPVLRLLRIAPPMHVLTEDQLLTAIERSGLTIDSVEHHATPKRSRDWRPFVVARKPEA